MSLFLRHESCPKCRENGEDRSGNNLGIWTDHKFCFKCEYWEGSSAGYSVNNPDNKKKEKKTNVLDIDLPFDCSSDLPKRCLDWLKSYGITNDEIEVNSLLWSEVYQRLIFPVRDNSGNLLYYQGRSFNEDGAKYSKYHTEGQANKIYHFLGNRNTHRVVVVEDLISAIKVGRHTYCLPLWGSNINEDRIKGLSLLAESLWIWLDKDKAEYSLKTRLRSLPYFEEVRCIITDKDPKFYNDEEIKEILK